MWRRVTSVVLVLVLAATAAACERSESGASSGGDDGFRRLLRGTEDAPWDVRVGVEQVTVTGATPGQPLTLYGPAGTSCSRCSPTSWARPTSPTSRPSTPPCSRARTSISAPWTRSTGRRSSPGRYVVIDESAEPRLASEVLTVPDRDDVPDQALYDGQELTGRPPRHPRQPQARGGDRRGVPVPRDARRGACSAPTCGSPTRPSTGPLRGRRSSSTRATAPPTPRPKRRGSASPAPSGTPRCR